MLTEAQLLAAAAIRRLRSECDKSESDLDRAESESGRSEWERGYAHGFHRAMSYSESLVSDFLGKFFK